MKYKINGLEVSSEVQFITYVRKPTSYEIKFGYGANHYKEFNIAECFDEDGNFKRYIVSKNDLLTYYYK